MLLYDRVTGRSVYMVAHFISYDRVTGRSISQISQMQSGNILVYSTEDFSRRNTVMFSKRGRRLFGYKVVFPETYEIRTNVTTINQQSLKLNK